MGWLKLPMVLTGETIGPLAWRDILVSSFSLQSLSLLTSFHFAYDFSILVAKQQIEILSITRTKSVRSFALCATFRSGIALLHISRKLQKSHSCGAFLPSSSTFGMRDIHVMACHSCNFDLSIMMCATFYALTTPSHFPRVHCAICIVEANPDQTWDH